MPYNVGVLDLLRATAATESENQARVRRVFGTALCVTHVCDVGAAVAFYGWEAGWHRVGDLERPVATGDFALERSALDMLVLAIVRALLFPALTALAIAAGRRRVRRESLSDDDDEDDDHNTNADDARSVASGMTASDAGGAYVALTDVETPTNNNNNGNDDDDDGDDTPGAAHKTTARLPPQKNRAAEARKHGVLGSLFLVSTAMQVYVGCKVNGFEWRFSSHDDNTAHWAEVALLCSSVLWTNVAAFIARELALELTRDEALYLPGVHPHGLVWDATLVNHYCDLCRTPIKDKSGGFRCRLCDFDVCRKCAARSDAAVVGENVLRTDDGRPLGDQRMSSAAYLARAIALAKKRPVAFASAIGFLGAYSALALTLPRYQGAIIDHVVRGNRGKFQTAAETYLALMILGGGLRAVYSALFAVVSRTVLYEVRTGLFRSMLRQDVAFMDGTTSGYLASRLTNDCQTLMNPIDASLSSLLYNLVMLGGGVVMCFVTSYSLAMLAFVVVGPIMYMWQAYGEWSKRLTRRVLAAWADANHVATEALAHIRTVKAFASERLETERYEAACGRGLRLGIRDAVGFGLTSALTSYLDLGTGVLILWYGGLIVLRDADGEGLTVGRLVTFQLYWNMMNTAYQSLQGLITSFTRAAAAAEKVFGLMDAMPNIDASSSSSSSSSTSAAVVAADWAAAAAAASSENDVRGALKLEAVSFFYAMRPDKTVLDDVTLDIPATTTCALVGRSGGGKSTIVSMLLRFYDPKQGRVTLDGRDVRGLDVRAYRRLFGVVMQDTPLLARTIRSNIAYGLDDEDAVPLAAVEAAAKQAFAHDFVAAMRDGYDTRVGERGGRLSGGQRQRIAIARVFLRAPKICLLDEATSALDEESQGVVQASLDALIARGGSTVLLVAHRLTTVMAADKIAVVDAGRIVEQGNHRELLAQDGVYAALVRRQLAKAAQHIDEHEQDPAGGPENKQAATKTKLAADDVGALLDQLGATSSGGSSSSS